MKPAWHLFSMRNERDGPRSIVLCRNAVKVENAPSGSQRIQKQCQSYTVQYCASMVEALRVSLRQGLRRCYPDRSLKDRVSNVFLSRLFRIHTKAMGFSRNICSSVVLCKHSASVLLALVKRGSGAGVQIFSQAITDSYNNLVDG